MDPSTPPPEETKPLQVQADEPPAPAQQALEVDAPQTYSRITLNLPPSSSSATEAARAAALVLAAVQRLNAVAGLRNAAARNVARRRTEACGCEVALVPGLRVDVVVNATPGKRRAETDQGAALPAGKRRRI